MKITLASLVLAIAGLAAASPVVTPDSDLVIEFEPGKPCDRSSRVACSNNNWEWSPHILVCANRGSGLKWEVQVTCPNGQTCSYDGTNNWAWCKPY
ncbi:hypothetical protein I7I50_04269 [Histoplasma capsulatum G186AR]|uniref:Uncharacterized protein n=1 Tax=Ajellomyces capsulatus TaxID=5037 RepID=A0A8H7YJY3_AJECA|nr:hypothetical protein I7I52_05177 [Histoplasma capsulatum]QSS75207.1 hypothetical protein I7I50_04269 [Histoplasma capsulatum G186AR]